jgi:hypothetical protein
VWTLIHRWCSHTDVQYWPPDALGWLLDVLGWLASAVAAPVPAKAAIAVAAAASATAVLLAKRRPGRLVIAERVVLGTPLRLGLIVLPFCLADAQPGTMKPGRHEAEYDNDGSPAGHH